MANPKFPMPLAERKLRSVVRQSLAVLLATTALGVVSAHAVDGTWNGPGNEWTDGTNWSSTPAVPDVTATFTNNAAPVVVDANGLVTIGRVEFTAAAPTYTITNNDVFLVNGSGIINDSVNPQTFNVLATMVFQNSSTASGGTGVVNFSNASLMTFQNSSTAGTAQITNNSVLQFSDTSTAGSATVTNNVGMDFFDSSSAGNANITNAAAGTLTFNSTATAGTATIGNAGTVAFTNSSTAGNANITNNNILSFSETSTAGNAVITTNNAAQTFFTGASTGGLARFITAAGGTFDMSGLTAAGMTAGSIEGAGDYVLGSKILTTGANNFTTQVDGVISGTGGGLIKVGTGTMALTNTNTFTGPTTISGGTLALTGFGSIANSSVVTVDGTFDISGSGFPFNLITTLAGSSTGLVQMGANGLAIGNGSTEFAGSIHGLGGLEIIAGTQTLSGANLYTNVTQIDAGATLALKGNGALVNSSVVTFSPGGPGQVATFDISQNTVGASVNALFDVASVGVVALGSKTLTIRSGSIFTGVIQDGGIGGGTGGKLTIANGAVQSLEGTNTYTGVTTIAAGGELDLGSIGVRHGSIATSSGVVNDGVFGIFGLSNGGTSIKALTGSGTGVVDLGVNTLTITNASGTFAGVIQDSGGGGGVTLTGGTQVLAGINTYTGNTTVNGGALIVDGSTALSALTTVNAGGTLGGSGIVGNTAITGGILAPGSAGSAFGPLTVQGTLSFTAASTYMIQVSPANAGLTNVTGTAALGGATVNAVYAAGSYVDRQSLILHATGGLGGSTFNPTVISNMSNIQSTLSYDADHNVYLNINLSFTPPPGVTLNVNQTNVANALTNFFNSSGSIPAAFAALSANGLTIASGELGTGVIQSSIKADDLFLNLLLDPSIAGRAGGFAPVGAASRFADNDEALAYGAKRHATPSERDAFAMARKAPSLLAAQPVSRWSVWGAAYGGSSTTDGNAIVGSHDTTARVYGVVAGADYKVTPDTLLGFALAGGGTSYTLSDGLGRGSSDLFQAGAFGRHNFGPAYVSAAFAYGWHDVTTNRTVALAGFDQLQGRFKAETFSGRFEGGYRFVTPMVGITPYAAAQVISFNLPAYAEQALAGGALFALNYASQTTTATRSELGLRSDKSIAMQDAVLTLRGRAAWAHDYNPDRAVTAVFQALPGASFVVNGARGKPDAALVSAGAEVKWLNGFSLMATFEGEFSGNTTSYAGKGVARYTW